jgi:hypothetical protein
LRAFCESVRDNLQNTLTARLLTSCRATYQNPSIIILANLREVQSQFFKGHKELETKHPATLKNLIFESFALLRMKFAQFGEESSNHEWTPMDTNRSVQFVFIRVHSRFFLILCGCGYAAL